jgi:hypothetical protein
VCRVTGEKIQTVQLVAGDKPLDFVEKRERIEGAKLGFEVVGQEPDRVAIGLARLRAA